MDTCLRWGGGGSVLLRDKGSSIIIVFSNAEIELRQRSIIVRKTRVAGVEGAGEEKKRGKKKYVYVLLEESLSGLATSCGLEQAVIDGFEARVTSIGASPYLTVITPGPYLYDYVIVSENTVAAACSGKRSIYVDRDEDAVTLYFT